MKRALLSAAALQAFLLCSLPAFAQTQFYISVAWTAPTTTTSASGAQPLTGVNALTTYKVYASTSPIATAPASPTFTATPGQTTAGGNVAALPGQTVYVYVTACDSAGCSALSPVGTKTVPGVAAIPDPPTGVQIMVMTPAAS
jgi:hypothetical protein